MPNPFIVARFVAFSLAVYLGILTLVFASWNIGAAKAAGVPGECHVFLARLSSSDIARAVPGAAIFLIFNSCALLLAVAVAMVELCFPKATTAQVQFECGWTAILSALQLAATLDATVNGPPVLCRDQEHWGVCASSYLVVSVSWSSSMTLLAYFLALFVTSMMHARTYPNLWSLTVYKVPWFTERDALQPPAVPTKDVYAPSTTSTPPSLRSRPSDDPFSLFRLVCKRWSRLGGDPESGPSMFNPESRAEHDVRAPWAQRLRTKRGVDQPFGSAPPSREGSQHSRPRTPPPARRPQGFPSVHRDEDLPIEKPRTLSAWVRADYAKGITVHTIPCP
ncbi:hypothetical protein PLICRDRAFT_176193 [Plicaturopsis crispa FD-325 SS-3]|nr:hypothetical protein PLICRDRAFT_176193 [Plicaturopsis crispa FD-325 SS-3]